MEGDILVQLNQFSYHQKLNLLSDLLKKMKLLHYIDSLPIHLECSFLKFFEELMKSQNLVWKMRKYEISFVTV